MFFISYYEWLADPDTHPNVSLRIVAFVVVLVFVDIVFVSYMMSSLGGKETKGKKKKPTVRSAPSGSDKNLDVLSVVAKSQQSKSV